MPNPGYDGKDKDVPKDLELLKGITGWAEPGQLTALMGGSGAGVNRVCGPRCGAHVRKGHHRLRPSLASSLPSWGAPEQVRDKVYTWCAALVLRVSLL